MVHSNKFFSLKTLSFTLVTALLGTGTIIPQTSAVHAASIPSSTAISVDADASQGTLFRSEQYFNISKYFTYADQREADIQFINDQGLHSKVLRIWVTDKDIYDMETDTYDFSKYDDYLSEVSNMGDALLVNLKGEKIIPAYQSPDQVKPILKNIITYLKQNYPKVKYIEAFNEPDDTHTKLYKGVLTPDNIYSYYKAFSDAVYEVNAELNPSIPLQVGGPTTMRLDIDWLRGFLDDYKNDPSPNKQLDFISYHGYFVGPNFTGFVKEDPSLVDNQRSQVEAELSNRGLSTDIPSFITETGIYPGPLSDAPNGSGGVQPDQIRQAAGLASLHYWYMNNSKNYAFQWELRHPDNARKDALVSRDQNNVVLSNIPSNKFTAYGNLLVMLSKMKATRVSAASDGIINGKGVYALAAKDDTGVSLMAWNYQGKGTTDHNVAVNIANLPSIFNGKHVRVKTYKIDAATSNYYASPDNSNLQMVNDKIVPHKGNYSSSVQLEPNSLQLLVLEPISKNVFLDNSFNEEVTGANPGWMVTEPADTAVSIANVPSVTDRSVYLSDHSSVHHAEISKSFESQSAAITAQWRFKDDADLTNARFQFKSGDTAAIDIYVNEAGSLVANGIVIQSVSPSTWYTVKLKTNPVSNKYEIYINDTLQATEIPYSAPVAGLDTVSFSTGEANRNSLYINDVAVYRGSLPANLGKSMSE